MDAFLEKLLFGGWAVLSVFPRVLGTTLLIVLATAYVCWKARTRAALRQAIGVVRDPSCVDKHKAELSPDEMLSWIELDPAVCAQPPFNKYRLLSLGDYFASLIPSGEVNMQSATITALAGLGMRAALPLATFMPSSWNRGAAGADGRTELADALMGGMMSTFMLCALGSSSQHTQAKYIKKKLAAVLNPSPGAAADGGRQHGRRDSGGSLGDGGGGGRSGGDGNGPLHLMVNGWEGGTRAAAAMLPARCVLARDLPRAVEAVRKQGERDVAEPSHVSRAVLPDLYWGSPGIPSTDTPGREAANWALAVLLNRLSLNALPREMLGEGTGVRARLQPFAVKLREEGEEDIRTAEGLVMALQAEGHKVSVRLGSNLTSFGACLAVRDDSGSDSGGSPWVHIPIGFPLATGMVALSPDGKQEQTVATMANHASVRVEISPGVLLPDGCHLEWCLSVAGFTGWGTNSTVDRPWGNQLHDDAVVWHSPGQMDSSLDQMMRTLRTMAAASVASNLAAERSQLMLGGYGALGVCMDSVACIQHALIGQTTMFPLTISGDAKTTMLHINRTLQHIPGWPYREETARIASSLASLPCDVLVEPRDVKQAARRALACLPAKSPFVGVERARKLLQGAIETAEMLASPPAGAAALRK